MPLPEHRRPFSSGAEEYWLDPLTLILQIPGGKQRFEDGPRLGREFHSHYLSFVHECAHWLQLQGSTWGALLQLVSYSQGRNALARLADMSARRRRRILEERFLAKSPIVRPAPGGLRGAADAELSENWMDHEQMYRWMLLGLPKGLRIDRAALLRFVLGACCPHVCAQAGIAAAIGDQDAADFVTNRNEEIFEVRTRHGLLHTKSILEGAATGQELLSMEFLSGLDAFGKRIEQAARRRLEASLATGQGLYGRAFSVFCETMGYRGRRRFRPDTLELFLFLCDLALNPPVAPFAPHAGRRWEDIYPPLRFARLLGVMKRNPEWRGDLSAHNIRERQTEALEQAGLPGIETHAHQVLPVMDYDAFLAGRPEESVRVLMEHQRYRFWAQSRCAGLRQQRPWVFVAYHSAFFSRHAPWFDKPGSKGWLRPPFRWAYKGSSDATLGMVDVDAEHGTEILLAAATDCSQYDLMRGRGRLRLSQFPPGDRDYLARSIRGSYAQRFGPAPWESW